MKLHQVQAVAAAPAAVVAAAAAEGSKDLTLAGPAPDNKAEATKGEAPPGAPGDVAPAQPPAAPDSAPPPPAPVAPVPEPVAPEPAAPVPAAPASPAAPPQTAPAITSATPSAIVAPATQHPPEGAKPMNESAGKWTPELKMQAFKEIVTAIMGLAVVIFTLVLAWSSLTYSANDAQMSNVKDILLLVLGLSGVVIGYYFGRIPADARTTLANAKAEKAAVQASAAADGLDNVIAKATGGAAARGAGGDQAAEENAAAIEELRRVRDNLRSVANS